MKILQEILDIVGYPYELDLSLETEKIVSIDFQGINIYEMHQLDQNYIDYFQFRRREYVEFWSSLDIYIHQDKNDELLEILNKTLIENKIITKEDLRNFNDVPNGETYYIIELDNKNRIDIMRIRDLISIQIIRFN
jgi:Ni,Fe-hydrogenase III large subunit